MIRVTDMAGSAAEGYPNRGTFYQRVSPKTSIMFKTARFETALVRINYEPDIPGFAGYEPSVPVYSVKDGSFIAVHETNVWVTSPPAASGVSPFIALSLGGVFAFLLFGRFLQ